MRLVLAFDNASPALSPWTRVFTGLILLVLVVGVLLLLAPHLVLQRWPWKLTPFNAGFLGAFYMAEGAVIAALFASNRWSPGRLVLIMACVFTLVVTVVTLLHWQAFNWERRGPWIWLGLYAGSALVSAVLLWRHWHLASPPSIVDGTLWPNRLFLHGTLATLYGLALLAVPGSAALLWPWKVDPFHAQLYSSLFLAAGIGALVLSRQASRTDLAVFGLANTLLGSAAIAALFTVDMRVERIDWSYGTAWIWLFAFSVIALVGLAQIVDGLHANASGTRQGSLAGR